MFSPCSQGVSSTKNPNRKNMQNNRTHVHPRPKMDSSLHLVPGRYKLPTAPGWSLRKDSPGWEKAENKFTPTSGLPACVCVLCRLHICTCVFQCVVCVCLLHTEAEWWENTDIYMSMWEQRTDKTQGVDRLAVEIGRASCRGRVEI